MPPVAVRITDATRGVGFLISSSGDDDNSPAAGQTSLRIDGGGGVGGSCRRPASEAFYSCAQCELFSIIKI